MSRERGPGDKHAERSLPHESDRDRRQPYAKEHEEYSGGGVIKPPKEETGDRHEPSPTHEP